MFENKEVNSAKERGILVILSTLFWYLFAHGYRMSNNLFSHDSLLEIYQDDSAWQIALGRFMHPFLIFLRGGIESPWLITMGSLLFLVLGIYLLTDLLQFQKCSSIILTAGVLTCNVAITCTNASFLQCSDFYSLAFALSVLGPWLLCYGTKVVPKLTPEKAPTTCPHPVRIIVSAILGILAMTVSMGIYQSYICVSIGIFMLLILRSLCRREQISYILKKALHYGIYLIVSALLYLALWKIFQKAFGIWTSDSYNGLSSVGDFSDHSLFGIIKYSYIRFFDYFWNPALFQTMVFRGRSLSFVWLYVLRLIFVCLIVYLLGQMILGLLQNNSNTTLDINNSSAKKNNSHRSKGNGSYMLLSLLIILLLPLGLNFVCVLSKGMEHTLMVFAFSMLYVYVLWIYEENHVITVSKNSLNASPKAVKFQKSSKLRADILRYFLGFSLLAIIWVNVVFANQVYLKKSLQEKAAESLMTRIVSSMESFEGYEPGVTPVAFSGYFENSPYLRFLPGFEDLTPYGMGNTILTYMGTDYAFLRYELNVPINETRVYADTPEVKAMPCYPLEGSIAYVDDVLVIKISD